MIIGKKDKLEFKRLKTVNRMLHDNHIEELYRCDLMNIIKAILNKFNDNEIFISQKELLEAEDKRILVTDDILRYGKRYRVIDDRNILKESEDKQWLKYVNVVVNKWFVSCSIQFRAVQILKVGYTQIIMEYQKEREVTND